jgi:hypothetical protein
MAGESSARISRSVSAGGLTVGGTVQTVDGDMVATLSKTVPATSTNAEFDFNIDISTIKAIGMEVSQDTTVKTNSTSAPDDTLAMVGGKPLIWVTGDLAALFLSVDVTKFYLTTGGNDTTFKVTVVTDSTPVLP